MSDRVAAQFAASARRYCEFVENAHDYTLPDRLATFAILLNDLHSAGLRLLEHINQPPAGLLEVNVVAPEVRDWIGFEELTLYWEITDPYEWGAPVVGSLTDRLLDIYRDIKRGLLLMEYQRQDISDHAIWEWQSGFLAHWGKACADALRAIHSALSRING